MESADAGDSAIRIYVSLFVWALQCHLFICFNIAAKSQQT